jgi:nicotinate-nucleotide adenylyltransferase
VDLVTGRRVGILGGTFDPIHYGHLVAAEDCRAQLGLTEVLFVPAGHPPHKRNQQITPVANRLAMAELAIVDNPHFRLSRVDVDRPGPSYSVDMVQALQAELGPESQLFFILGRDSLLDLPTWHEPDRLAQLCQLVAVTRPGYPPLDLTQLNSVIPNARERIISLEVPELNLASSDIRRRVAEGRPIRYLVPESVRRYIKESGLYHLLPAAPFAV